MWFYLGWFFETRSPTLISTYNYALLSVASDCPPSLGYIAKSPVLVCALGLKRAHWSKALT